MRNKSGRLQAETLGSFLGGRAHFTVGYDYQYGVADSANGLLSAVQFVDASTYSNVLGYDDRGRPAAAHFLSFEHAHGAIVSVLQSMICRAVTARVNHNRDDYTRRR